MNQMVGTKPVATATNNIRTLGEDTVAGEEGSSGKEVFVIAGMKT